MAKRKKKETITDMLRRTIVESEEPYLRLEKATGVKRATIMRFVNETQTIHLDAADRLAEHFGLELRSTKRKAKGG